MSKMQPMTGVAADDLESLPYPLLASTKMDGCRSIVTPDGARTRSMKTIPNRHMQRLISSLPHGLDGEIGVIGNDGAVNFRATSKAFMTEEGESPFVFHVFDNYLTPGPFLTRWGNLPDMSLDWVKIVNQREVYSPEDVRMQFSLALSEGHEGLILRRGDAAYKFGKSTLKEAGLLKVKPWQDDEAVVVGMVQEFENTNEAVKDERGLSKRSSAKSGKVPKNSMGTLIVRSPKWPSEFEIGTGFNAEERALFWKDRDFFIGKIAKFKYIMVGGYDVPRSCVFLGFRPLEDTEF